MKTIIKILLNGGLLILCTHCGTSVQPLAKEEISQSPANSDNSFEQSYQNKPLLDKQRFAAVKNNCIPDEIIERVTTCSVSPNAPKSDDARKAKPIVKSTDCPFVLPTMKEFSKLTSENQLMELMTIISTYSQSLDSTEVKQLTSCDMDVVSFIFDVTSYLHLEAVGTEDRAGTGDKNIMSLLIDVYNVILKGIPNLNDVHAATEEIYIPDKYGLKYFIAELYWHSENWRHGWAAFSEVVELNPNGKYALDSAFASILCFLKFYIDCPLIPAQNGFGCFRRKTMLLKKNNVARACYIQKNPKSK